MNIEWLREAALNWLSMKAEIAIEAPAVLYPLFLIDAANLAVQRGV